MKQHYLFHDRSFVVRQVVWAWIILFISTLLFATIATVLSLLNLRSSFAIGIAFSIMVPMLVWIHYHLHRNDYKLNSLALGKPLKSHLSVNHYNNEHQALLQARLDFTESRRELDRRRLEVDEMRKLIINSKNKRPRSQVVVGSTELDHLLKQLEDLYTSISEACDFSLSLERDIDREIATIEKESSNDAVVSELLEAAQSWLSSLELHRQKQADLQQRLEYVLSRS